MSYFSRLTDIVTCSLSRILAEASDPETAIESIIAEMEEGLQGAKRSVTTATSNEQRLTEEITQHRRQIGYWDGKAREALMASDEAAARLALIRRSEVEDLIAGLEQQHEAAVATREHLTTMQRALEARLAEARRKRLAMKSPAEATSSDSPVPSDPADSAGEELSRSSRIEAELEALKRQVLGGK